MSTETTDRPLLEDVLPSLAAAAAEHDRGGRFPYQAFDRLHSAGVLNLTVPRSMGGEGAGVADAARVIEEIGRADPSVGLVTAQHLLFHASLVHPGNAWPPHLRDAVQRSSVESVALINGLRVEPDLGTPARGGLPATVAERLPDDAGWRLTGQKLYSTGIRRLEWLAVWARTDDPEPLVGTFLVRRSTPGWHVIETWDHLGMRATESHDVVLDGVVVPLDHAVDIRPPGAFGGPDVDLLAWNNLLIAALYNGVARSARDWLVGYLHERVPSNLGAPLASLPRFQSAVGEIEAFLATNELLIHGAAATIQAGAVLPRVDTALVKYSATSNAIKAVEVAIALVGNPGLSRANPLERHYRDVLCSRIHTPQDDSIVAGAGRAALDAAAPDIPPEPPRLES